ncbi:hypothetical protein BZG36_05164 [Bifiguratus adelaidae]|uniref:FAD/NAD(P)-binding domain-containing protein n=1 Tax=Bifiguratus adelaidae TaxID=1938954 RepID=A0A261XU13_9FUNG|nr:hypothetical protein BZG36_05164 [Bifiguratus adelaidae]
MTQPADQPHLVVIGGGAAGLLILRQLSHSPPVPNLKLTLIDHKAFFEYTPSLIAVLFAKEEEDVDRHYHTITRDYEDVARAWKFEFIGASVEHIDQGGVRVKGQSEPICFTHLVIAVGSLWAEPWSLPSSSNLLSRQERLADLRRHRQRYLEASSVLCVGGGPLSVEIGGEILTARPQTEVTIVSSSKHLLSEVPAKVGEAAKSILCRKNAKVIVGEKAREVSSGVYETSESKERLVADLVYLGQGSRPNTAFLSNSPLFAHQLTDKGNIRVDDHLRLHDHPNIYAIGDCNSVSEPKMFYTAHMQAIYFLQAFTSQLRNEEAPAYQGVLTSQIVSLGPSRGVAYTVGLSMTGYPFKEGSKLASVAKWAVERMSMDVASTKGLGNRALYAIQHRGGTVARMGKKVGCL